MKNLRLAVKRKYFDQIKSREKTEEFRLDTEYWRKRLVGRDYETVTVTLGYPKSGDTERTITRRFMGCRRKGIRHEHFGPNIVTVFAIDMRGEDL